MINDKTIEKYILAENDDWREGLLRLELSDAKKYYKGAVITDDDFVVSGPVIANYMEGKKRKVLFGPPAHTLCIGGTGAGKSQCYYSSMIECLARSKDNPSMFVMDLKGEFYKRFAPWLKEQGYKVYVWDAKEPLSSDRYNPVWTAWDFYQDSLSAERLLKKASGTEVEYKGTTYQSHQEWRNVVEMDRLCCLEEAQSLCRRIANIVVPMSGNEKDPSWLFGAQNMLYLVLLGMLEDSRSKVRGMTKEKFTLANAIRTAMNSKEEGEIIDSWIDSHLRASEVHGLQKFYPRRAKVTRDGYEATLASSVVKWRNISTEILTSASDIDVPSIVKKLDEEKVAIFCITDETRAASYDLCALFMSDIVTAIKRRSDTEKPLERPFHFLFDEFGNMPSIEDMDVWISTLRSYKVWLHLGIQSYSQLDDNYSPSVSETIKDNCSVKVFFGCNNATTVGSFIDSVGHSQVMKSSYTLNGSLMSKNLHLEREPLLRKSDLTYLTLGEAYVTAFRLPCLHTRIEPYFMWADIHHNEASEERPIRVYEEEKVKYDIEKVLVKIRTAFRKNSKKLNGAYDYDGESSVPDAISDLFGFLEEEEKEKPAAPKATTAEKKKPTLVEYFSDDANGSDGSANADNTPKADNSPAETPVTDYAGIEARRMQGALPTTKEELMRIGIISILPFKDSLLFPRSYLETIMSKDAEYAPWTQFKSDLDELAKKSHVDEFIGQFVRLTNCKTVEEIAAAADKENEFLKGTVIFDASPWLRMLLRRSIALLRAMTIEEYNKIKNG